MKVSKDLLVNLEDKVRRLHEELPEVVVFFHTKDNYTEVYIVDEGGEKLLLEIPTVDEDLVSILLEEACEETTDYVKEYVNKFLNEHGIPVKSVEVEYTEWDTARIWFYVEGTEVEQYEGEFVYTVDETIVVEVILTETSSDAVSTEHTLLAPKNFIERLKETAKNINELSDSLKDMIKKEVDKHIKNQKEVMLRILEQRYKAEDGRMYPIKRYEIGSITVEFKYGWPYDYIIVYRNGECIKECKESYVFCRTVELFIEDYVQNELNEYLTELSRALAEEVAEDIIQEYDMDVRILDDKEGSLVLLKDGETVAIVPYYWEHVGESNGVSVREIVWYTSKERIKKESKLYFSST